MKHLFLFLFLFLLISCSNNENNDDFIIGKWRVIERYDEFNNGVDLNECDEYVLYDFKTDFSLHFSYSKEYNDRILGNTVFICGLPFGSFEWLKIDDTTYKSSKVNSSASAITNHENTYRIENNKLIITGDSSNSYKIVLGKY